jgi:hypothetical protein
MHLHTSTFVGFEHESPLTGTFEVSLTRAVLPYGNLSDRIPPGGRIQDIGLGVVVDGADTARSDILDLGSAEIRVVDLSGPLVILGWLYPSGLRSLRRGVENSSEGNLDRARAMTLDVALRALQGAGFGPLTRPTLLRIGFRDLTQDLDLHEDTAIRLLLPSGGVVRIHMDYEAATLIARTGRSTPNVEFERTLSDSFPGQEILRGRLRDDPTGVQAYHLPFSIPRSFAEARGLLSEVRRGLVRLLAHFEPERSQTVSDLTSTFGERDSLRSFHDKVSLPRLDRDVSRTPAGTGMREVH